MGRGLPAYHSRPSRFCFVGSRPPPHRAISPSPPARITTPCMPLLADVIELHGSKQYGVFYSMVDVATSLGGGPPVWPVM